MALAWLLRLQEARTYASEIYTWSQSCKHIPLKSFAALKDFFQCTVDSARPETLHMYILVRVPDYICDSGLLSLQNTNIKAYNALITDAELWSAIKDSQPVKAPGLDGLPLPY